MNCLTLRPARRILDYSGFPAGARQPVFTGAIEDYRGADSEQVGVVESLRRIQSAWRRAAEASAPDLIAVRSAFGGEAFPRPAVVGPGTTTELESLIPFAPLHTPALIALIEGCARVFPTIPVVLVFDTSFFADLPRRESYYGLDPALMDQLGLRRFGYHGLFHDAACGETRAALRKRGGPSTPRIVSICLEPRPEVTAVIGFRPVMVTSGATLLEGLPGQRTCGELDPSIVLTLSNELGWGPEKINEMLTQESGIFGLVDGRPGDLKTLFENPDSEETRLAREVMDYRILLACGSAVAAMGGVDVIVFSGRHGDLGRALGPRLAERLTPRRPANAPALFWTCFDEPLDRIVADRASAAFREKEVSARRD